MNDELDDAIREAKRKYRDRVPSFLRSEDDENAAIAAAIRSRWPWIDWPCVLIDDERGFHFGRAYRAAIICEHHNFGTNGMCGCGEQCSCGYCQPKPGPAPANSFTAVVKGKKVEVGDVVKLNDDGTVSKVTPEDERGEDAEAIKMWRDK